MTSHKEQPAVDTSAEKLLELASTWETAAGIPNPDAHADLTPEIAVKTIDLLKGELARGAAVLRRLSTQLRDAQARGKGMEETSADLLSALEGFLYGYDRVPGAARDKMFADARAAIVRAKSLSRPEGSAS